MAALRSGIAATVHRPGIAKGAASIPHGRSATRTSSPFSPVSGRARRCNPRTDRADRALAFPWSRCGVGCFHSLNGCATFFVAASIGSTRCCGSFSPRWKRRSEFPLHHPRPHPRQPRHPADLPQIDAFSRGDLSEGTELAGVQRMLPVVCTFERGNHYGNLLHQRRNGKRPLLSDRSSATTSVRCGRSTGSDLRWMSGSSVLVNCQS